MWYTDSRSCFGTLQRAMAKTVDKRLGNELESLRLCVYVAIEWWQQAQPTYVLENLTDTIRWVDTAVMVADCLTKPRKDTYLLHALCSKTNTPVNIQYSCAPSFSMYTIRNSCQVRNVRDFTCGPLSGHKFVRQHRTKFFFVCPPLMPATAKNAMLLAFSIEKFLSVWRRKLAGCFSGWDPFQRMSGTFGIGLRIKNAFFGRLGPSAENVDKSQRKCKKTVRRQKMTRFRTFAVSKVDHVVPRKGGPCFEKFPNVSCVSLHFPTLLSPCFLLFCSPVLFRFPRVSLSRISVGLRGFRPCGGECLEPKVGEICLIRTHFRGCSLRY